MSSSGSSFFGMQPDTSRGSLGLSTLAKNLGHICEDVEKLRAESLTHQKALEDFKKEVDLKIKQILEG